MSQFVNDSLILEGDENFEKKKIHSIVKTSTFPKIYKHIKLFFYLIKLKIVERCKCEAIVKPTAHVRVYGEI